VAAEVEDEFPELALVTVEVPCRVGRSAPWVAHRLAALADRVTGPYALRARTLPVPALHRAFFAQVGLDPDRQPPPFEAAILHRLRSGGFVPTGMPADALLIALLETGVGVWAADAAATSGPLGVRPARDGEPLGVGRAATPVDAGELVLADDERVVARLFHDPPPPSRVGPDTRRAVLYALQVPGVPALAVQEALTTCRTLLRIA
jgi:DNA/RNA-binding domain of Phe-tRNA-synthetase-like protein